jgi:AcrR family transcriptional regulator
MAKLTNARTSKRGSTRLRVLEEATKTLNRYGVSQTSLTKIAENVGVSRAALYYYIEDQEDLVFQCYTQSCEQMARILNRAAHSTRDPLAIVDAFIEGVFDEEDVEFAALSEVAFLRPAQRETILGLYEGLGATLVQIFEAGMRRGEIRQCRATVIALTIVGLVSWIPLIQRWPTAEHLSRRELIDAIKDTLRNGLAQDRSTLWSYTPFKLTRADLPIERVFDAEARNTARQEVILAAASWIFNMKGVDATSLEEIAARLGVTKKVIYHNMGDKQALVIQCHRRAYRFYESIVARMLNYDGARIDAVSACVHAFAEASLREDIAPLPLTTGYQAMDLDERNALQDAAARLAKGYIDTFQKGAEEGNIRQVNARAVVHILPGLINWLPKWFDAIDEADREAVPAELAALYRLGLRPI